MSNDSNQQNYKSWPFVEAQRLLKKLNNKAPEKGFALFQTGYGPSGLPHIGTFAEVLRTTMVRKAFEELSDIPTKLVVFSDDMDGLRKVPTNVPQQDMLEKYLNMPLTSIPDPFEEQDSFGAHNNNKLKKFLDSFDFEYEFCSATEAYQSGRFDEILLKILQNHEKIKNVILPTLGKERRETYSPFLPVCPDSGKVLQAKVIETKRDSIVYEHPETGKNIETKVTGGACKLQWKADWAMRMAAQQVDYEMCGKDLIDSFKLSSKIVRILGESPPENLTYEMFLGKDGDKISKSKGNGLSLEEWLSYAPQESLAYYLYQSPKKQKRLYFDSIPKAVDEYLKHLNSYTGDNKDSPLWHIHHGDAPYQPLPVDFSLLLNLAAVCNPEDKSVLWGFISKYAPKANAENMPLLDKLAEYAVTYYRDKVEPTKQYRSATETEKTAMQDLVHRFKRLDKTSNAEMIQEEVYTAGMVNGFQDNLRDWFKALYEVLLGQSEGPRFGSFTALYGLDETINLISSRL